MKHPMTAFWVGVLTLGIEIVAGRLMAPYFGSSLHQWAALIGVVLLAYVLGYAMFKKLTRFGPAFPLALGGVYILLLPIWLFEGMDLSLHWPLPVATVVGAIFAVGIPSFVWAGILPFLQREAGDERSARMLAWSAAGNLAGAWGVAFLLIPQFGTRISLVSMGGLAIFIALVWTRELGRRQGGAAAIAILLAAAGSSTAQFKSISRIAMPWKTDSGERLVPGFRRERVRVSDTPYQEIGIWDEVYGDERRRALSLNGSLQFLWSPKEKLTRAGHRYDYYNYSTAAALWVAGARPKNVLVIGLGGGLVPWQLRQFFPDLPITVYELDPGMVREAKELLPSGQAGAMDIRVGDGRNLLREDLEKYDYILLDTFLNSYVPFHLTTREFFALVRSRLSPGGILVANFHSIFERSGLLPKLQATIQDVFPSVGVISLPAGTTLALATSEAGEGVLRQRILLAGRASSSTPVELGDLSRSALAALTGPSFTGDRKDLLLTDDLNDTEQRLYETRQFVRISRPI